ncbi:hypothetical protein DNTS_032237 [Danionella cerebrum]|uniref:Uncharacterized protein n=1 Tax=Danionella cerebrum TaxID=2873325 RepID=A0A553Q6G9_9TELE|nr:hypothetical protein DNTS_032237 [Danionella translucida]
MHHPLALHLLGILPRSFFSLSFLGWQQIKLLKLFAFAQAKTSEVIEDLEQMVNHLKQELQEAENTRQRLLQPGHDSNLRHVPQAKSTSSPSLVVLVVNATPLQYATVYSPGCSPPQTLSHFLLLFVSSSAVRFLLCCCSYPPLLLFVSSSAAVRILLCCCSFPPLLLFISSSAAVRFLLSCCSFPPLLLFISSSAVRILLLCCSYPPLLLFEQESNLKQEKTEVHNSFAKQVVHVITRRPFIPSLTQTLELEMLQARLEKERGDSKKKISKMDDLLRMSKAILFHRGSRSKTLLCSESAVDPALLGGFKSCFSFICLAAANQ